MPVNQTFQKSKKPIGVIGAGAFGSALSVLLAQNGCVVKLWDRNLELIRSIQTTRRNPAYLPDVIFSEQIELVLSLSDLCRAIDYLLLAVPSHAFEYCLADVSLEWGADRFIPLVWVTKGLASDGNFLHTKLQKQFPDATRYAVLSGPSFAREVALGLPTMLVGASIDQNYIFEIQSIFQNKALRIFPSSDVVGVQWGGVCKNILAVACGLQDGLQWGSNARAALMTQGWIEMVQLGVALGAQKETLFGLSGLGDMILTCTDNQSRNRQFGLLLASGQAQTEARSQVKQVVEAARNLTLVSDLAKKYHLKMPVTAQLLEILDGRCTPEQGCLKLFEKLGA